MCGAIFKLHVLKFLCNLHKIFVQHHFGSFSIPVFAGILPKIPQKNHAPVEVRVSLASRCQSICAQRGCRACYDGSAFAHSTTVT